MAFSAIYYCERPAFVADYLGMEMRFANTGARRLFLFMVVALAAALVVLAGRNGLADIAAQSSQPDELVRAARLEPENADYWHRLGRYRQLDAEHADLPLAISYYQRAVQLDPRTALYWLDLAGAYEMAGEAAQARQALETAQSAYPISAEVAWRYGNFLLRRNEFSEAFAEIRRAVATDPKLAALAISRCWRASGDMDRVLKEAVPARAGVYLPALEFFVSEEETDAAMAVWKHLLELKPSLELRRAFPLVEELIRHDRVGEARTVWREALHGAGQPAPDDAKDGSLVYDGGFERDFAGGGFGWRQTDASGARFDFDTETRRSGARSLRITFDGAANIEFGHLLQLVPVAPQTHYTFSAYLRTEALSTNSGIRFRVFDPRHSGEINLVTAELLKTNPWTRQEYDVLTGPQTHLLGVQLVRAPSQKLDNKLSGTVWVDDVALSPIRAQPARH